MRQHVVYRNFKDYPIVFVKDWQELTDLDLDFLWTKYSEELNNEHRIYFEYWKNKINI